MEHERELLYFTLRYRKKRRLSGVISDRNFRARSVNYAIISCSLSFILSQHANEPRGGVNVCFRTAFKKLPDAFKRGGEKMSPLLEHASAAPVRPCSDK